MFSRLLKSSEAIRKSIVEMWLRFPLVSILTVLGTTCGYQLVTSRETANTSDLYVKIIMLIALGVPYLLMATLVGELYRISRFKSFLIQLVGVGLLVIYYFFLPEHIADIGYVHGTRIMLATAIGFILLLSLPLFKKSSSDLWVYSGSIVRRVALAVLFTITVWVGLALALLATDYLFDLSLDTGLLLMKIWVIDVGIVGTWIILGGFPKADALPENMLQLSRALRWLLQYVLVSLLTIFFLILYAYLIMIVATWNWPKGGVAQWILGFSIVGMILFIVSYTIAQTDDFKWLRTFFKTFFVLLIPMTVVLFMAVGIRIKAYGITEQRYMIVVGGIWLLMIALYYLLSKTKSLHAIPYSVALVFIAVAFLPFVNMFALSEWSQVGRLKHILESNNILVNGKVVATTSTRMLSDDDSVNVESILSYLGTRDELKSIEPWFNGLNKSADRWLEQSDMAKQIGLGYYTQYQPHTYFGYTTSYGGATNVSGNDYIVNDVTGYIGSWYGRDILLPDSQTLHWQVKNNTLEVTIGKNTKPLVLDLEKKVNELYTQNKLLQAQVGYKDMTVTTENKEWRITLVMRSIVGSMNDHKPNIENINGLLLLKKK